MKKLSNWFLGACAALFCAVSALPALAEDPPANAPTVDTLVDTSTLQSTLITSLQSWVLIGIGIGISVLVVFLGWKWIRRFMGR